MSRDNLFVRIELADVHCHDEGDGPGSAEPYLWAAFFKIDGETISVSPSLTLAGSAVTAFTLGSHGNLVNTDVDDGENLPIPPSIGHWQVGLRPIPVPASLSSVVDDVGGVVGVVTVLLEEDSVTDDGAEAGHSAFNRAVRDAINQIVATRTFTNQDVSAEELAGLEDQIHDAVSGAVQAQQNVFENLWSWLNADDTIGFSVFVFRHDDLLNQGEVGFSHRWHNEGDWEITGTVTATKICPAEALQEFFGDADRPGKQELDIDELRRFRDGMFREVDGLIPWFRLIERNVPALLMTLRREPELRDMARRVFEFVTQADSRLDAPLNNEAIREAATLARKVSRRTSSRRLRIDAGRAADLLPIIRGDTNREGVIALGALIPARNSIDMSRNSDPNRNRRK